MSQKITYGLVAFLCSFVVGCGGSGSDNPGESPVFDASSPIICNPGVGGSLSDCEPEDSTESTIGGEGDDSSTPDEVVVEDVLNPDDCTSAQLSALEAIEGLTAEEIQSQNGYRIIGGTVQYEDYELLDNGSIDYTAPVVKPVYGASAQAVACDGSVLDTRGVSSIGQYYLLIPLNIDVTVSFNSAESRVDTTNSDLYSTWTVRVIDNTLANDAIHSYAATPTDQPGDPVIQASQVNEIKNFLIPSGWNGTSYDSRPSAPFAIADVAYRFMDTLTELTADDVFTGDGHKNQGFSFDNITLAWSPSNVTVSGNKEQGQIGESHYDASTNTIYLLGEEGVNTDEFDDDVIRAMLTKYLMEYRATQDTIAGDFTYDSGLYDPRVSFYEGFAIGFATGFADEDYYKDSRGTQASTPSSISYDVEDGALTNKGFASVGAIAMLIHDIVDAADDDNVDFLSYEMIEALEESASSGAFMTIFPYISALKRTFFADTDNDIATGELDAVLLCDFEGGIDLFSTTQAGCDFDFDPSSADEVDAGALAIVQALDLATELDALTTAAEIVPINAIDSHLDDAKEVDFFTATAAVDLGTTEYHTMTWGGVVGGNNLGGVFDTTIDTVNGVFENLPGAFAGDELDSARTAATYAAYTDQDIILPIYKHYGVFGTFSDGNMIAAELDSTELLDMNTTLCSTNVHGTNNALGARAYAALTIFDHKDFALTADADVDGRSALTFTLTLASGDSGVRPVARVYKLGDDDTPSQSIFFANGVNSTSIDFTVAFIGPGMYVLELSTVGNAGLGGVAGEACFDLDINHFWVTL